MQRLRHLRCLRLDGLRGNLAAELHDDYPNRKDQARHQQDGARNGRIASMLASDNTTRLQEEFTGLIDGGANWQAVGVDPTMCPTEATGNTNQCSYDHWITPDPANPLTVYFGSIDLYKSMDGGSTWSNILNVYSGTGPPGNHAPGPACGGFFTERHASFIGNDGGVYRSDNGGTTFQNLNASLGVSQFNGVALHPSNPDLAMGGTQDNGGQLFTGSSTWSDRIQGDGGFVLFRRDAPAQVLAAHYRAYFETLDRHGTVIRRRNRLHESDVSRQGRLLGSPWPSILRLSRRRASPSTVFFGTNRVWRNDTFGSDPNAWQPLSSGRILSSTTDVLTTIGAAADSNGPLWAGSRLGEVQVSTGGSSPFVLRNAGLPSAVVTRIVSVTAERPQRVRHIRGLSRPSLEHVFRTTDAGVTWTNISNNLPDVPILDIKVDPTDPTDIFLGSDVGVFRSTNGGASWTTFNAGLPTSLSTVSRFTR